MAQQSISTFGWVKIKSELQLVFEWLPISYSSKSYPQAFEQLWLAVSTVDYKYLNGFPEALNGCLKALKWYTFQTVQGYDLVIFV